MLFNRCKRIGMCYPYATIKNIHYENDGTDIFRDNLYCLINTS